MADVKLNEVANVANFDHVLVVNGTQVGKTALNSIVQKISNLIGVKFFRSEVSDLGQHEVVQFDFPLNRLCVCYMGGSADIQETIRLNNPIGYAGTTTGTSTFISDPSKTQVPGKINLVQDDYGNLHIYGGLDSVNEFTYFRVIDLEIL